MVIVAPFSGPLAEFGRSMLRGGRMRIGDRKDHILTRGRVIKLIALDDKGEDRQAMMLAENMSSLRSIWAVIGHLTTGCTLSAVPLYNAAQLIHISPVAIGGELEGIRCPFSFRTILTESQQAVSLADYIYRIIDSKEAALIYEDTRLGHRMRNAFLSRSKEIGLSVESIRIHANPFPDLKEVIDKIVTVRAQAIFFAGGPRLAGMVVRKWPKATERPLVFGTYRLVSEEFTELAGIQGRGVLAAHPCVWRPDFARGRQIKNRYERRFKYMMDWLGIQTYDAVDLLLWAANNSGVDPGSVRTALLGLNSRERSLRGLAGPIYFNPDGSLAREVAVATYTGSGWKLKED